MSKEHGNLSINSQNIFPIIKKWMYSDHDIFYRELVSNACDAITKLKKLSMIGEYEAPDDIDYKVEIKLSANDKTIKIIDNGIGMTKEEVDEWKNYNDPIIKYRNYLVSENIASDEELDAIQSQVKAQIDAAYEFAQNSPDPELSIAFEDVWVD